MADTLVNQVGSPRNGQLAMSKDLETLLAFARKHVMTGSERENQRRSFAFGNTKIENARITQETVNREADRLAADGRTEGLAR